MKMLSNEEARRLLQTARIGRLGCIVNGEPYVVPLNYCLEGDFLYSHSLAGLKITGLRENPNACVQVDEMESDLRWRSAIGFGKYERNHQAQRASRYSQQVTPQFSHVNPGGVSPHRRRFGPRGDLFSDQDRTRDGSFRRIKHRIDSR